MNATNSIVDIFPFRKQDFNQIFDVTIAGSKSHTIRALLLAALAKGKSTIVNPLISGDTLSCIQFLKHFSIDVTQSLQNNQEIITVESKGYPDFFDAYDKKVIDLGNSGTTLYFATALAALSNTCISFDGDASLRMRSALPLLKALETLGATITNPTGDGCVPYSVQGPLQSGNIDIICSTSQYLSALILALSLLEKESTISAKLAGEFPYVAMTIAWLRKHNIRIEHREYKEFTIFAKDTEHYMGLDTVCPIQAFIDTIPGDFSSAAFFLGYVAITGQSLCLSGLQQDALQADMKLLDILAQMGCNYEWVTNSDTTPSLIMHRTQALRGGEFDLSEIPDSLPILSVVACFANTPTRLYNVAHARKKETDRIAVMATELAKLDCIVEEFEDGLTIFPSTMTGGTIESHHDHRIAMSFAIGAVGALDKVTILNADAVSVTFPTFFENLSRAGVSVRYKI